MSWSYSYLQGYIYKRFDGAVNKTVLLKDFDKKAEGFEPQ